MSTAELIGQCTRLPAELENQLICPRCQCRLDVGRYECKCTHPGCGATYPVRRQVPVLINESSSLFSIAGIVRGEDKPFPSAPARGPEACLSAGPVVDANVNSAQNYHTFAQQVLKLATPARVLVDRFPRAWQRHGDPG